MISGPGRGRQPESPPAPSDRAGRTAATDPAQCHPNRHRSRPGPGYIRCDSRNALTPSATCWKLDSPITRP
jgi:hypothetical protein